MQRLITHRPQLIQNFLRQQQPDSIVWQRLATQVKPATQTLLQDLFEAQEQYIPVQIFKKTLFQKAGFSIPVLSFTKEQLTKLKAFIQHIRFNSLDTRKTRLLRKIMQLPGLNWIQHAALFDWLPEAEFKTVQLYFSPENRTDNLVNNSKLEAALQLLNPVQMEFLLYPSISTELADTDEPKESFNKTPPPINTADPENYTNSTILQNKASSNFSSFSDKFNLPPEEGNQTLHSSIPVKSNPDSLLNDNHPGSRTINLNVFSLTDHPNSSLNSNKPGFSNQLYNRTINKTNTAPD
ncbi:hypothetical protein [Adhaeribacter radiodurans]|uniref:Uncharacterized protein n=1 Tax=Adhaeribacter radiodurans TaxID=2745197 RepID=A0A7L7L943_9BACT|nr:hypothetical protein [Adhaeribacter radiodurans]QMU29338.1 hypothetical protein HUW48_15425 [Adhaeribacter radiodurans]